MKEVIIVNKSAFNRVVSAAINNKCERLVLTEDTIEFRKEDRLISELYISKQRLTTSFKFEIDKWRKIDAILKIIEDQPISITIGKDGFFRFNHIEI